MTCRKARARRSLLQPAIGRVYLRLPAVLLLLFGLALPGCQPPPDLSVENANSYPLRIAQGPEGRIYVSDASAGSVFIYRYDPASSTPLVVEQEIKGLERPLGVAVDQERRLFVGIDERDCVEVFDRDGFKLRDIGLGEIQMPSDIAVGPGGEIFIADSLANTVLAYDASGTFLRSFSTWGSEQLAFPAAIAIATRGGVNELYVSDQGNGRIVVFTLDGSFLRTFGSKLESEGGAGDGKFGKAQSLVFDAQMHLHVVDAYKNNVQILDPADGSYLGTYGSFGKGPGEFNLPLDSVITSEGEVLITNSGNARIERFPEAPSR